MRATLGFCLAILTAACSLSRPQLEQNARALAGWVGSCFPAAIAFLPDTDRVSPGSERMNARDLLRHAEWLQLGVEGGSDGQGRAARSLANRRAQAAVRLLNLKAMCETCGTMMHRRARLASIAAVMPGLDVQRREASPRLTVRPRPSLNCDKAKER